MKESANMSKRRRLVHLCRAALYSSVLGAVLPSAAVQMVNNPSDYVVLSSSDMSYQSSIATGVNFPNAQVVGNRDYLVNVVNRVIRSPNVENATTAFAGRSLSIDNGANLILKGAGSTTTFNNLYLYNAFISQGDGGTAKALRGNLHICGTYLSPSMIQGSACNGGRRLFVYATIHGDANNCVTIKRNIDDGTDKDGEQFYTHFIGTNSNYRGWIHVSGGGNGVSLVGYNNNSFGPTPNIKLSNGGKLFGGGGGKSTTIANANIVVSNSCVLGVYEGGANDIGLQITKGAISGTGTLKIDNSRFKEYHSRRVVLGDVSISDLSGITVRKGALQLGTGSSDGVYSNSSIPITVEEPVMLRAREGSVMGDVTLKPGAYLDTSNEKVTLKSLVLEATANSKPFIRRTLSAKGLITINGNITRKQANEKIIIDVSSTGLETLVQGGAIPILAANNLGTPDGLTADDFKIVTTNSDSIINRILEGGAFSVERKLDGRDYLYFSLKNTCAKLSDNAQDESAFKGTNWIDGKVPHGDFDYYVTDGIRIRSEIRKTSVFEGKSLSILKGGTLSIQGLATDVEAKIDDLRLYGGSVLNTTTDWGNHLDGKITIYGDPTNPAIFETEWSKNSKTTGRALTIWSQILGNGSLLCRYGPSAEFDVNNPAILNLRGNNNCFTGSWQVAHPAAKLTVGCADNFGAATYLVLNSNGVFHAEDTSFTTSAGIDVKDIGSESGEENLANGGTIIVDADNTLTFTGLAKGAGVLRKAGGGTLLCTTNNLTGKLVAKEGFFGGKGYVGTLEIENGAGIAFSATGNGANGQLHIGTLKVNGDIALNVSDLSAAAGTKIFIAKVDNIVGTLKPPRIVVANGRSYTSFKFEYTGGKLYLVRNSTLLRFE